MTFYDALPWSIDYKGSTFQLTASYDYVLKMYEQLDGLLDYEKVDMMLYWLIKGSYPVDVGLLQAICGILFTQRNDKDSQKAFDYIQDGDLIYAAFRQAYNIDLYEQQGKLHWLQFVALMSGLPSNTRFAEIVQIRTMPLPKATKENAERRAEILRLKSKYQLQITEEERQRNLQEGFRRMANVLMNMG